jgi:hypothetical protein
MHPFGMFASFLLLDGRSTKSRNSEPDLQPPLCLHLAGSLSISPKSLVNRSRWQSS